MSKELPQIGTILTKCDREGNVRAQAQVQDGGIYYNGAMYKSLSASAIAAARDIGLKATTQDGWAFWGLKRANAGVQQPGAPQGQVADTRTLPMQFQQQQAPVQQPVQRIATYTPQQVQQPVQPPHCPSCNAPLTSNNAVLQANDGVQIATLPMPDGRVVRHLNCPALQPVAPAPQPTQPSSPWPTNLPPAPANNCEHKLSIKNAAGDVVCAICDKVLVPAQPKVVAPVMPPVQAAAPVVQQPQAAPPQTPSVNPIIAKMLEERGQQSLNEYAFNLGASVGAKQADAQTCKHTTVDGLTLSCATCHTPMK